MLFSFPVLTTVWYGKKNVMFGDSAFFFWYLLGSFGDVLGAFWGRFGGMTESAFKLA